MDQLVLGRCVFSDIVWFCNIIKQAMHPEELFFCKHGNFGQGCQNMLIVCCRGPLFKWADVVVECADDTRFVIFMFDCRQMIFQEWTEKGLIQPPEIGALSGQMVWLRDFLEHKCPGVVMEEHVEQGAASVQEIHLQGWSTLVWIHPLTPDVSAASACNDQSKCCAPVRFEHTHQTFEILMYYCSTNGPLKGMFYTACL